MKHVFIVHSPITYIASLGVVLTEELNPNDVLIISENFSLEFEPIKIHQIENSCKTYFRRVLGSSIQKKLYKFLDKNLLEDKFIAYFPVFHYPARFLVNHDKCSGFNFIEEGLLSYYSYYPLALQCQFVLGSMLYSLNLLKKIKQISVEVIRSFRGYTSKINAIPPVPVSYFPDPNISFYGFHSLSYKNAANRIILDMDTIFRKFNFKSQLSLDRSYIWISDPDIRKEKKISESDYIDIIEKGYLYFLKKNNVHSSFIKFHPRDTFENKELTKKIFIKNNINYEIISDNTILELELFNSTEFTLVGFYSSLLIYGAILGGTSYSIINYSELLREDPLNDVIGSYWNFVNRL